jgi:hypothetical protein
MQPKQNNGRYWITQMPVLIVYLLFFTVQIFFNLDISSRHFRGDIHASINSSGNVHAGNYEQDLHKTPAKSKIRLNKRFQPSGVPCIMGMTVAVPLIYAQSIQVGLHADSHCNAVFLYTYSLRGPPVVA